MARRRHYKTSEIKQIELAVKRFDKLNNQLLEGNADIIRFELNRIQNLLHIIKKILPETERLYINSETSKQINEIEEKDLKQRNMFKMIYQWSFLSEEAKGKIEKLNKHFRRAGCSKIQYLFGADDYSNLKICYPKLLEYEKLILRSIKPAEERDNKRLQSSLKRKEKKRLSSIKRNDKEKQIKAMAAAHAGKTRQLAHTIKRNIEHQRKILSVCPYCGLTLDNNPKADHIYPVAKGGLSTEKNMVYVCAKCNSLKSDKTLREFVKQNGWNWTSIEKHLEVLRKDF